jgi:hypothetical protein
VGKQVTIDSPTPLAGDLARINALVALADAGKIDLIVKGLASGVPRGWYRIGAPTSAFQSDVNGVSNSLAEILALAGPGAEFTFTAVTASSGMRMGVDRDGDAFFDHTEVLQGSDPADPLDFSSSGGMPVSAWGVLALLATALGTVGLYGIRRHARTARHP